MTDPAISSAEYREVQEDRLTDNRRSYPLSAFFDGEALERYHVLKNMYDPSLPGFPATFEETDLCQQMLHVHAGEAASLAVRTGNVAVLSFLTGLTHREVDLSQARTLIRLLSEMRRDGFMGIFTGHTDNGKTNTALWLSLLLLLDLLSQDVDVVLATNVRSLTWQEAVLQDRTHYVGTRSELEELCQQHEKVVCVLDELEIEANATTNNYAVNDEFANVMTFKSKYGLVLFPIFHRPDGKGAAPLIRQHASYFLQQIREEEDLEDDEYRVEFHREYDEDLGATNLAYEVPVPPIQPDGSYNPDEEAQFDISS
ncbi:hypothetical protein [Natrialba sp. SSL1]|uniref:hypothetical protein n=1 Tax=Natrialba sp. SSL1 TaxID=1869245 RepID=UPI0011138C4E|nr:hypothetical protein [Natrialba sp. SSL1]